MKEKLKEQNSSKNETFLVDWSEQIPFVPGQIVALELYSLDDDHFFPDGVDPEKAVSPSIILPAVVSSVKFHPGSFPIYTVRTVWRTNSLDLIGYIEIPDLALWRYVKLPATLDTIPKWFIEGIDLFSKEGEENFFDLPIHDLCYLDKDEKGELKLVYKWREEIS